MDISLSLEAASGGLGGEGGGGESGGQWSAFYELLSRFYELLQGASEALQRGDDTGDAPSAATVGLTLVVLLALLSAVGTALGFGVPSAERWLLRAELHGTCKRRPLAAAAGVVAYESVAALRLERRLQRARHGGEGGESDISGGVGGGDGIHVEETVPIVPCDGA